jgi:hypothetical protein
MKIPVLLQFAPWAGAALLAPSSHYPRPNQQRISPKLFTATTDPTEIDPNSGEAVSLPYFATPKETVVSPPEIPPPYEFDDPVDLSVVVSWVS